MVPTSSSTNFQWVSRTRHFGCFHHKSTGVCTVCSAGEISREMKLLIVIVMLAYCHAVYVRCNSKKIKSHPKNTAVALGTSFHSFHSVMDCARLCSRRRTKPSCRVFSVTAQLCTLGVQTVNKCDRLDPGTRTVYYRVSNN